jgi:cytidine deaminase
MKEINIATRFTAFENKNELPHDVQNLIEKAIEIRKKAYAPYSKFRVGVAILLDNGEIVLGSNQENAAYPSGLCAERVAIFYAGANYPDAKILTIAISATSDNFVSKKAIPPCGSCRQSLVEYELKQEKIIEIYFMGEEGEVLKSESVQNLLPFTFDKNFL